MSEIFKTPWVDFFDHSSDCYFQFVEEKAFENIRQHEISTVSRFTVQYETKGFCKDLFEKSVRISMYITYILVFWRNSMQRRRLKFLLAQKKRES